MFNKKELSETDIRSKYIDPSILKRGWSENQIKREHSFTDGRIIVSKKGATRGVKKKVDYMLYYKANMPLAIVEAKSNKHSMGSGMQQGIDYSEGLQHAEKLDIPFIYSSNGDGFIEHDRLTGREVELGLDEFPSPEELWRRYCVGRGITPEAERIVKQDYFFKLGNKTPRYYQRIAINRTIEAVSKGQDRVLLVMATGTGKTYTAFQIIHRLWKAREKKRILFLADRNILIDQTMANDFRDFDDKMIKINRRNISKAHEIYLGLYQSMTGTEEWQQVFKEYSPEFFDLVVVDECHRGSAKEDSAWREVLNYFSSATHIGLTATPKETNEVSNIHYFGEPLYTYSLKEGIEDGFLAPYKVMRKGLDKDLVGYRPERGKVDKYGNEIVDREYNVTDFDKSLVLEERTKTVAKEVTKFLKATDRFSKTIVFCIDIDHAERMRQALINENSDLVRENPKYVMRITGDNPEGKAQLDNFIDPGTAYPVIATTSKLMTTGVDAKTCKLIVLDSNINSMTEFKQIIGRGTRVDEAYGKSYFTIMDFRDVTRLFSDPDFDGEPIPDKDFDPTSIGGYSGEKPPKGKGDEDDEPEGEYGGAPKKFYVDDVEVKLINERVQYLDASGKLITESLVDYSKKNIKKQFATLDEFLSIWNRSQKKEAVLAELHEKGIFFDELKEEIGRDMDEFDLICHLAFDRKPLTRRERAKNVKKKDYFSKYEGKAREVLEALLTKYTNQGISQIEGIKVLKLDEFKKIGGSPAKVVKMFGGKDGYLNAVRELEQEIYAQ
ncbi:DEAD/DEAH box helicase [Propionigenium maris DSM 9537]|uniref:DEAD/DEAH box helicase n=1 Tax=Propionigenium maris DSM 9537 TaxID=1123000 RepID=A0A9W6GP61_9FUSO|nr:DEAD/DEAH box helicase family protein [Propionigenium maris]GLI57321.1 DEAD/DEAH box helicase [Propionigenium maris DSM 9537]